MFDKQWHGMRKRRTRQHVIEELSINFFERKVLQRGHMLVRAAQREYGWDASLFHFSPGTGEIENGEIRIQFKATDRPLESKKFLTCRILSKDLHYWYWESQQFPFILIAYVAPEESGYWIDIRSHVDEQRDEVDLDRQTNRLRIPLSNKVTVRTIDQFRQLSLGRMQQES